MHRGLAERYCEVSTLLLVPITPHTCEHVWTHLLKKQGSVLTAGWPQSDAPDFVLQRAAQYIESTIARWVAARRFCTAACRWWASRLRVRFTALFNLSLPKPPTPARTNPSAATPLTPPAGAS